MLQRVRKDDGVTKIGGATAILHLGPHDGPLIEAPSLFYKHGVYFLFFSSNCFSTDLYDISYATATNIDGQYVKASVPLMQTKDGKVKAPGGADVNRSGSLIAFHGTVGTNVPGKLVRNMYTAIAVNGRQIGLQRMIS